MMNIDKYYYKITNTKTSITKNGITIFHFQLNNSLWVKLSPFLTTTNEEYNTLYNDYKRNTDLLHSLIGNYIQVVLIKNIYGIEIEFIITFDMVNDFKQLLDKEKGKPFSTSLRIYDFLKLHKYPIESDGSIRLKKPYDFYYIIYKNGSTICSRKYTKKNILTLDNIEKIYNEFYKGKKRITGNVDKECKYYMNETSIYMVCEKCHKYKSKIINSYKETVLELGDDLKENYIKFLNN